MPSYNDIIDAIMFADASAFVDGGAFYDPQRDAIYLKGADLEEEQAKIPDDVDWDTCIEIPSEKNLDLGRALVDSFVEEYRPDDLAKVRGFFARRGAYRRFRFWTDELGLTELWYAYRNHAEHKAVIAWCAANNVPLTDIPELEEVPDMPQPAGPPPTMRFPMPNGERRVVFIANTVKSPKIEIGDYTYSEESSNTAFEERVLALDAAASNKLIIGRFCSIGHNVRFLMSRPIRHGEGFSTYPFSIFGQGWENTSPTVEERKTLADTVVGNDVTIGFEAFIMPGVKIGDGAIIEPRAVVTTDVAPYTVVAGAPAREIHKRFPEKTVAALQEIAWWDWDVVKITENLAAIAGADLKALKKAE